MTSSAVNCTGCGGYSTSILLLISSYCWQLFRRIHSRVQSAAQFENASSRLHDGAAICW